MLGVGISPVTLRRFWTMLAHYHGQLWNGAELARALGVAQSTVRRYLDLLESTGMIRVLQPWFENLGKRQIKAPKVWFKDSGLLHSLLGCNTFVDLRNHPKYGASWEGYAKEAVLAQERPEQIYFWATQNKAELDLMIIKDGKRHGFEFKCSDAPRLTPSLRIAKNDLQLASLTVLYPGTRSYELDAGIIVKPLNAMFT